MQYDKYPREIKNVWSKEDFEARIMATQNDMKGLNQAINTVNSQMNELRERKKYLQNRIGKKAKYINQLKMHIADIGQNNENWQEL